MAINFADAIADNSALPAADYKGIEITFRVLDYIEAVNEADIFRVMKIIFTTPRI